MSELNQNYTEAVIRNIEKQVECGLVVEIEQIIFEEKDTMFELETHVSTEFADKTYSTEAELASFLATLTTAQLANTEIIVDEETYIVFYPLLPAKAAPVSGYHFDTDYPRPTVATVDVPELVGELSNQTGTSFGQDRESYLSLLLASVLS